MRNWLRFIAALEVIGGAYNFVLLVRVLLTVSVDARSALVALFLLAINALSVVAGVALWGGRPAGRTLSIIVQAIQLPKIATQQMVFLFSLGLDLWVYAAQAGARGGLGFRFDLMPASQLFFNAAGGSFSLAGASLSSVAFLALLITYKGEEASADVEETTPPHPADWAGPPEASRPTDSDELR